MFNSQDKQSKLSIRPAAVAGMFYPADAGELDTSLDHFLTAECPEISLPKAIIAPHAGYVYSGSVAASAYTCLAGLRDIIKRVVLLGPAHRVYVDGIALPTSTHFATPLGNVPLDTTALQDVAALPYVEFFDDAHRLEHSLEVHIPFLQKVLDDFQLLPMVVGNASSDQVATVLDRLWGGAETLIVISSDLSHYHEYHLAKELDAETTQRIETLDYRHLNPEQACGCMPLRGLLKLAQDKQLSVKTLDLRNSGDTAGPRDSVVGYGAYALYEHGILDEDDKETVFAVMRRSIEQGLNQDKAYRPDSTQYPPPLNEHYAVFVTLKLHGELRGCIGTTEASMPLIEAVAFYAHAAAFNDPRFRPLTAEAYPDVEISLSILTPASLVAFDDEQDLLRQLRLDIDGLIIEKGNRRATFLPVVWESITQPALFLSELKRKAGIGIDESPDRAWRYTAEYYS